jgi:urease gamma subunit
LTAGISLLTDTAEGGLRDVAQEVQRLAATGVKTSKPKARAATQRRVSNAARRGRSVRDIAATEQMAESEVRLRLQLADAGREKAHATVR